jgi:hypothetical protein
VTLDFFHQLLRVARSQVDIFNWIKRGGLDAEEFLECIESGRWHPVMRYWESRKATKGVGAPKPTTRDEAVRRMIVLAVIAFQRMSGMSKTSDVEARRIVAAIAARLFEDAPSAESIHHWQRELGPTFITPADEKALAVVIANAKNPAEVVEKFVQIAHTIHTPAPFEPLPN